MVQTWPELHFQKAGRWFVPKRYRSFVPTHHSSPARLHGKVITFIISSKWSVTKKLVPREAHCSRTIVQRESHDLPVEFSTEIGAALQIIHRCPKWNGNWLPHCPATNGHQFDPGSCWKILGWFAINVLDPASSWDTGLMMGLTSC